MKKFKMNSSFKITLLVCFTSFSSIAFSQESINKAVAVIQPTKGNSVRGIVTFTREEGGVRVIAEIDGLKKGEHGIHVHEFGDCSAANASTVGDHFNPTNKKHGFPHSPEHHVGDLGNIFVDETGHGKYDHINTDIQFEGKNSIIGRAIIIHEGQDDGTSQPSGNAGGKLGCGVIGIAK